MPELIYFFIALVSFLLATYYISKWVYKKLNEEEQEKEFDFDAYNDEHFGI